MATTIDATPVDQPLRIDASNEDQPQQQNGHRHSSGSGSGSSSGGRLHPPHSFDQENGADTHSDLVDLNGELSPSSLRRSTRASALKAQEKLKHRDGGLDATSHLRPHSQTSNTALSHASHDDSDGARDCDMGSEDENSAFPDRSLPSGTRHQDPDMDGSTPAKRRRLARVGHTLNQSDCRFGIRVGEDGEVELMTDESDVSSLDENELAHVRSNYKETMMKELDEDARMERERMLAQLEAELRLEEAKLTMLKKIRISQQMPAKQPQDAQLRKAAVGLAQNTNGTAYRPPVAQPQSRMQQNAIKGLNQLLPNGRTPTQSTTLQQQASAAALANSSKILSSAATTSAIGAGQTPQQKAAAAKLALRRQLEQQLLQVPAPRAPPPELYFIPNGNQPDFCYLLGLDLAVQRVLRDKNATRRPNEGPYLCEECGTDFTPVWKAIGRDENSLHLYCEQCVKTAQKRQLRQDHTALLRKAFAKIAEKEMELEKQIVEGKFDVPALAASPALTSSASSSSLRGEANASVGHERMHAASAASGVLAAAHQPKSGFAKEQRDAPTAAHQHHSSHSNSHQLHQHKQQTAALAAAAAKRSTSSSLAHAASSASSASSAAAVAQQQMQQQLAAAAALRNIPMFAAMMANPLFPGMAAGNMANILQMGWNPAVAQRFPNLAMAALAEAAAQTARQQSSSGGTSSSASGGSSSATLNAAAAAMNQAFMKQFAQQREQLQRQMMMELLPKSGSSNNPNSGYGGKFK